MIIHDGDHVVQAPPTARNVGNKEGQLKIERQHIGYHCGCGKTEILVLPNGDGKLLWVCSKCNNKHCAEFHNQNVSLFQVV